MPENYFGTSKLTDKEMDELKSKKRPNPRGRRSKNVELRYGGGFPKGASHAVERKGMGDLKKLDQDLMDEKNLYRKGEKKHKKEMDRINKKKGK